MLMTLLLNTDDQPEAMNNTFYREQCNDISISARNAIHMHYYCHDKLAVVVISA